MSDARANGSAAPGRHYRGLLIDWGGVLTSDLFDSFRSFCELEQLAPDAVARRFRSDAACRELLIGLETGLLDEQEFEPQFAAMLGVAAPGLIDRMFAGSGPDEPMLAAVRRAREGGIKTGLISNSWGTRRYPWALLSELFDGTVISGEVGIRKPAPEIYALGAECVGLDAPECVFVDDLEFNLTPAQELGMATVHHVDSQRTIAELEQLLGVELR